MPKTAEKRCFQARWANFFTEMPLEGPCWANFFAPIDIAPGLVGDAAPFKPEVVGGFALHEAVVQRVAGVSDPRVVQFPRCSVPHPVLCAHRVSLVC